MHVVDLLSGLANETRIAMVRLLKEQGELCVNEVVEKMGLTQANASHHLNALRAAGLTKVRKDKCKRLYSLAGDGVISLLQEAEKLAAA